MTAVYPNTSDVSAPAHAFGPQLENRPSPAIAGPLRVAAFNAHGGVSFAGIVACLEREPLKSASILLLCEADFATRRTGGRHVASDLAARLGLSVAYVGEFGLIREDGGAKSYLGNAILSRQPMEEVFAIPLPNMTPQRRPSGQPRGWRRIGRPAALVASVRVGGKRLRVCVAHLDSRIDPAGREHQMTALLADFPPDGPAIIGGDLNTTTVELTRFKHAVSVARLMLSNSRRFRSPISYEPLFRRLGEAGFEVRGANADGRGSFTFSRMIPPWLRPRLDWIALRELRAVAGSAAVISARPGFASPRVSDHDFVMVDVAT